MKRINWFVILFAMSVSACGVQEGQTITPPAPIADFDLDGLLPEPQADGVGPMSALAKSLDDAAGMDLYFCISESRLTWGGENSTSFRGYGVTGTDNDWEYNTIVASRVKWGIGWWQCAEMPSTATFVQGNFYNAVAQDCSDIHSETFTSGRCAGMLMADSRDQFVVPDSNGGLFISIEVDPWGWQLLPGPEVNLGDEASQDAE